ncbi:MAG: polyprenyl synthetase family protein [Bacteriovoracaceae bacterium]
MSNTELEAALSNNLQSLTANINISSKVKLNEAMNYSVLPAGKLFRPKLAMATYLDKGGDSQNLADIYHFCSFLEFHHAYSLVHDDLPSMDDDDMRRGRASTHKAYGEWMGVLTGDALLSASYQSLTKIKHPQSMNILKFCTWALGPKGLILGQAYDMSGQINSGLADLLLTHLLKTGRLIQCALVGGRALSEDKMSYSELKKYMRMGKSIGLIFQLIDDLSELADDNLGEHEKEINRWISSPVQLFEALQEQLKELDKLYEDDHVEVKKVLSKYFQKMKAIILDGQQNIKSHLGENQSDLIPVIQLLERLC